MTQFDPKQVPQSIGSLPDPAPHRPAQDDTDETYYEGSPQLRGEARSVVLWTLLGLILIALPITAHVLLHWTVLWWVYVILIALGIVFLMIPSMSVKNVSYKITNYRINVRRGLLSKTIDSLELWHVEDLQFHQSLFDRIMRVGSIEVLSHNPTIPKLMIRSIPHAEAVFDKLQQRIIAVKRQQGVLKVDTGS